MTREHKLSLLLGFAIVLVVGVLISDHLSGASQAQLDSVDPEASLGVDLTSDPGSATQLALVGSDGVEHVPPSQTPAPTEDALALADGAQAGSPIADESARSSWIDPSLLEELRGIEFGPSAAQTTQHTRDIPTIDMSEGYRQTQARPAVDLATMPEFSLYQVRPGDSLWSIAQRELGDGKRHAELAALNRDRMGKGNTLRVGATIRIPVAGAARRVADRADAPTSASPPEPAPTGESRTYTVKKGDTLSEIAQELLGTIRRMDEILEANEGTLDSANDLKVGMTLTIPPR